MWYNVIQLDRYAFVVSSWPSLEDSCKGDSGPYY